MAKGMGKIIAQNRKAHHDYFIEETYEAGIVLMGSEIKSIRMHRVNINDAYIDFDRGEAYINGMHISPYKFETKIKLDPIRKRKLLLHKKEINRLRGLVQRQGYTIIPLKIYIKDGFAKLEIAVAKGKKQFDKREAIKRRDADREMRRAIKDRYLDR